jgi:hypothetical protein
MPNKLVRVTMHRQMLKFGPLPDSTRPQLVDTVTDKKVVEEALKHNITRIGVRLSYAENRALFAVQRILDNTGFKGNARSIPMAKGNPYKMRIKQAQPLLDVSIAEYLEAYGDRKTKTSRQKQEYSVSGRRSALAALATLADKKFLLVYTRDVYHVKNQGQVVKTDIIETVDTLITIERQDGRIKIVPSPILYDQQDTYYMILPANLYTEVVLEQQKSLVLFIEYLFYHYAWQQRNGKTSKYIFTRQMDTVAAEIGREDLIDTRQRARLRKLLNGYYEFAKALGYLNKYEIDAPGARYAKVDRLHLRAAAMNKLRKIAEAEIEDE